VIGASRTRQFGRSLTRTIASAPRVKIARIQGAPGQRRNGSRRRSGCCRRLSSRTECGTAGAGRLERPVGHRHAVDRRHGEERRGASDRDARGYLASPALATPSHGVLAGRENPDMLVERLMRRRFAIEPVIGHIENEHRKGRNHLPGKLRDAAKPNRRMKANCLGPTRPRGTIFVACAVCGDLASVRTRSILVAVDPAQGDRAVQSPPSLRRTVWARKLTKPCTTSPCSSPRFQASPISSGGIGSTSGRRSIFRPSSDQGR